MAVNLANLNRFSAHLAELIV